MSDAKLELPPSTELASPHRGKVNWWRWFWITTLVVSAPYAWYCFYVPSNSIAWADDYASAQQQSAETSKPIILFFTGKWCVPCRIMKRNVWADEQVTTFVNASFIPVTIDVDVPDAAELLRRYHVVSTPNTVITDSQGSVLQQKAGGLSKDEFLQLIVFTEAKD